MLNSLALVTHLCDELVEQHAAEPVLPWHWGPALLGFALSQLEDALGDRRYTPWLRRYCDYYVGQPPVVHSADTAAPALVTNELARKDADPYYAALTERVVAYLRHAPRLTGDVVNHLGTSPGALVYPRSVWVDSLMMAGVFPARYGAEHGDRPLLDMAAQQPRQYAELLLDPEDDLWAHAYWMPAWHSRHGRRYPGHGTYWARGNGWVVTALPMMLDAIGPAHAEADSIGDLLARTSAALLACRRADGTWTTVLTGPRRGYRELSATALIAGGWLHAVGIGALDGRYRAPAHRALQAVLASLRRDRGRWVLPEVSAPTVPLPGLPRAGYALTPTVPNASYGVAALVFAALSEARFAG